MSNQTTHWLAQLPPEIVHVIFYYLDVPDILRVRRVSRYLNEISHSRQLWTDIYRTAGFVRPPGPFHWQSTHHLEKALVRGFRVDRNLSHSGPNETKKATLKLKEISYLGLDIGVNLVFGRFLLIGFRKQIQCYDLDVDASNGNSEANIIYRSSRGIVAMYCRSAIDVEGRPFACAVLIEEAPEIYLSVYLLREAHSKVTLDLVHQFNGRRMFFIDTIDLGPRAIVLQGEMGHSAFAVDVHTRTQFLIPSSEAAMEAAGIAQSAPIEKTIMPISISTSTHVVFMASYYRKADGWMTFLQAFALPSLNSGRRFTSPSAPLNPSHSGVISNALVFHNALVHDSVVDSSTQDVLITIRVRTSEPSVHSRPLWKYGILRLSPDGTVAFQFLGSFGQVCDLDFMHFMHPSFRGNGRVFYVTELESIVSVLDYDLHASGDDGKKNEIKTIEYIRRPASQLWDFDPYSGRICFGNRTLEDGFVEIIDLGV